MRGLLFVLSVLCLSSALARDRYAAADDSSKKLAKARSADIMFLGVYHMSNPALDDNDVYADDVLSPKRQQELDELADKLGPYQPTKICIEATYRSTTWTERYQKYLAGQYKPGRGEIEQIGFRLAKRAGLKTLHGFDYPMFMSGLTPAELEYTKPPASHRTSKVPTHFSAEDLRLRASTVTAYLQYLNSDEFIEGDQRQYLMMLLPIDNPAIYAKTDMIVNWHKHNLRMFTNLNRIVEFGKDRVLVMVGSGHLKILRDLARAAPYYKVVDVNTFLQR